MSLRPSLDRFRSHASHNSTTSVNAHTASAAVAAEPQVALAGHLSHLTESQAKALDEFRSVVTKEGLYRPVTAEQPLASHDDATLLRYLRARKFDVNAALMQFKDTEHWRKENHIDDLYEKIDITSYEDARKMYPQWTGCRDRRGHPVYVYVIRDLNSKNMAAYDKTLKKNSVASTHTSSKIRPHLLRLFALYENMTRFVFPLCTALPRPNPETPITGTTNIVDITGVGLKQFWNLKSHMQDASTLATAHYPETLDKILIIGAPYFFPTVWGWIKRWFDPVTTSKIFILSPQEAKATLTSFIEPSSLPKQYGGDLDWTWGSWPALDADARDAIGAIESKAEKGWIPGPVYFDAEKKHMIFAGSEDGKDRKQVHDINLPDLSPKAEENKEQEQRAAEEGLTGEAVAAEKQHQQEQHEKETTQEEKAPVASSEPVAAVEPEHEQDNTKTTSSSTTTAQNSVSTDTTIPDVPAAVPIAGSEGLADKMQELDLAAAANQGKTVVGA